MKVFHLLGSFTLAAAISPFNSTYAPLPYVDPAKLPSTHPNTTNVAFEWGRAKVQGVSLGGWLVLEGFIKPSLYKNAGPNVVDEWTFCETLGKEEALSRLQHHWSTWVTLEDFQKIKKYGLTVVRIPIGYWAYADFGDPFVQGAAPYIDSAIKWARKTGLKIILDLHGAPRSQNGWEHSGRAGRLEWGDEDSVNKTLEVLTTMSKYGKPQYQDVVIAIQILNEPWIARLEADVVKNFYQSGYDIIRDVSDTAIILSDGFLNPEYWDRVLIHASGVVMDHHEYQIFAASLVSFTLEEHNARVCSSSDEWAGGNKLQVVGEWSAAMTDCAPWLNGRGGGSRYGGTMPGYPYVGSCSLMNNITSWTRKMKDDHRKYVEAQLDSFESRSQGWIFWNFKTELAHEWDFYALVDAGVFPQPLSERVFPKYQCP